MSGALDSRRLAEYRRRVGDPAYLARALAHVAGLLTETLLPADKCRCRGVVRDYDPGGDFRMFN